jgi:hypothetical protein
MCVVATGAASVVSRWLLHAYPDPSACCAATHNCEGLSLLVKFSSDSVGRGDLCDTDIPQWCGKLVMLPAPTGMNTTGTPPTVFEAGCECAIKCAGVILRLLFTRINVQKCS